MVSEVGHMIVEVDYHVSEVGHMIVEVDYHGGSSGTPW